MGIADRPYYRDPIGSPQPTMGRLPMWSFTTWLIVINVVVFVLGRLIGGGIGPRGYNNDPLVAIGYFSAEKAIFDFQIWRFITFQFLHGPGFFHIFFNMLVLYFFGPMIESYLGSRRYLGFYLLCGVSGTVFYVLLAFFGILPSPNETQSIYAVELVGASAGIFGVLIAAARIAPNTTVMLLFPPIPMPLKVLAWILIGIAVLTVLVGGGNAGGEAAHLGGAALGFFLIRSPELLNFADAMSLQRAHRAKDSFVAGQREIKARRDRRIQEEVDRILEKVHREGLHSLTRKERRTLQQATEMQRRGR